MWHCHVIGEGWLQDYVWPHHITHLNRQLSFIFRNDNKAHEISLMALVILCFQGSSFSCYQGVVDEFSKCFLCGCSPEWTGKRESVQRDHIAGQQSCSRNLQTDTGRKSCWCFWSQQGSCKLGLLWAQCNLEVLCLRFSVCNPHPCVCGDNMHPTCWGAVLSVAMSWRIHGIRSPH